MSSLYENKPLFCSLIGPLLVVLTLVFNLYPEFATYLEIVEFSSEVSSFIYVLVWICQWYAYNYFCTLISFRDSCWE